MPEPTNRRSSVRSSNWDAHLVLGVTGLMMLAPFLWQLVMSVSTQAEVLSTPPSLWPDSMQWQNYARVFEVIPLASQLWVSVVITVLRTVGQLVLCALAGYAFARMNWPGKPVMLALVLSILMIPTQAYLIPQYQIVQSLHWLDSVQGIVVPGLFSAFGTFMMRQFFMSLPDELAEAARLDGCNSFQVFSKVMLPLAKPGLASLAVLTILWSWNDLLWPLVITNSPERMPVSVGLATLQGQSTTDYPLLMAASAVATAPLLIMFIVMQRRVIEGIAFSGLK